MPRRLPCCIFSFSFPRTQFLDSAPPALLLPPPRFLAVLCVLLVFLALVSMLSASWRLSSPPRAFPDWPLPRDSLLFRLHSFVSFYFASKFPLVTMAFEYFIHVHSYLPTYLPLLHAFFPLLPSLGSPHYSSSLTLVYFYFISFHSATRRSFMRVFSLFSFPPIPLLFFFCHFCLFCLSAFLISSFL